MKGGRAIDCLFRSLERNVFQKVTPLPIFFWFEFQELLFLQDPSYLLVRKPPPTKILH